MDNSEPMTAERGITADELTVKVFADGADVEGIVALASNPLIKGFTTNPTLMHAAGLTDYEAFARDLLSRITDRPVSLEVFSDDHDEMIRQARLIASWGPNVNVKIPITDTKGEPTSRVLRMLASEGITVNVTGLMTVDQVRRAADELAEAPSALVSVFAGRIADTGLDPMPIMRESLQILERLPNAELIWASPREVLNIVQANEIGCDIITVTHALLGKLGTLGHSLDQFSLETVQMFYRDAQKAGFVL